MIDAEPAWMRCIDDPGGGLLPSELGRDWQWRHDPFAATISYRHERSGLWTALAADAAHRLDGGVAAALSRALHQGVSLRVTGPVEVMARHRVVDGVNVIGDTWLCRPGKPWEVLT